MRTSILNTATTEQMGYGIISFFVCFPLMNQIVIFHFLLLFLMRGSDQGEGYLLFSQR